MAFGNLGSVVLLTMAMLVPDQANACRVPHQDPEFDALILIEVVASSPMTFRATFPAEMNNTPFFSIYLKYQDKKNREDGTTSAQEIEIETENGQFVAEFSISNSVRESEPKLVVMYQGSMKPCPTVAIKDISRPSELTDSGAGIK